MLQSYDQSDASGAEHKMIAWLEEQACRTPAQLKYKGYRKLVSAFSERADVPAEEASAHTHTPRDSSLPPPRP